MLVQNPTILTLKRGHHKEQSNVLRKLCHIPQSDNCYLWQTPVCNINYFYYDVKTNMPTNLLISFSDDHPRDRKCSFANVVQTVFCGFCLKVSFVIVQSFTKVLQHNFTISKFGNFCLLGNKTQLLSVIMVALFLSIIAKMTKSTHVQLTDNTNKLQN